MVHNEMQHPQNQLTVVQKTVQELYRVFAQYPFRLKYYCPCCIDKREIQILSSSPLALLTERELVPFTVNALLTVGDLEDVKYFLPRMFELLVIEGCWPGIERFVDILVRADWTRWPISESQVLLAALLAFWDSLLITPATSFVVPEYINAIAQLETLSPFLCRWQQACIPLSPAVDYLASWMIDQQTSLAIGRVKNYPQPQETQILRWLLSWQELETLFIQSFVEAERLLTSQTDEHVKIQATMDRCASALQVFTWLKQAQLKQ